jgi:hypothetical protein
MEMESSEEYRVLKAALSSKKDPVEAAIAFTKPTREAFVTGRSEQPQLENSLWRSWASIVDIAIEVPHESHGPLIEIVRAVQKQNVADNEDASEIEIWGEKLKVWRDMPVFGAQAREQWNRGMFRRLFFSKCANAQ